MGKRILVINGHPDPRPERFCAALCDAYAQGSASRGLAVDRLAVGMLTFLPPESGAESQQPSPEIAQAIEKIRIADRLAIVFPFWLDGPPGMLRELFENYARSLWTGDSLRPKDTDYEKNARVFVTMDMPSFIQRPSNRAGNAPAPAASAMSLPGVRPFQAVFIGSIQSLSPAQRNDWLQKARLLGSQDE